MSDKVKEEVQQPEIPEISSQPKLDANGVLSIAQTLIAENLNSAEEVRDVICALVGDLMVNGFKSEQLQHRMNIRGSDGSSLVSLVTINVELFQKVGLQPVPQAATQPVQEEVEKPE